MSVLPVTLTWAVAGLLGVLLLPRVHRRRLAPLIPLAAAVAALASMGGGADLTAVAAPGGLVLGRPAGGLVLLTALAVTVCLVLSPPPDSGEILVLAASGALAAVALATGSPLVWGVCFVAGFALVGIRWMTVAPGRVTLAAGRIPTVGASALVAAAPFLPLDAASAPTRAHLAAGLLAAGVAAGLGLLPLGGWVVGGRRSLRGAALAPWALVLVPALVLSTQGLPGVLPAEARSTLGALVLAAGALSAAWAALRGVTAAAGDRYARLLLADTSLVAMGLAAQAPGARVGSLLLVLTHLCAAPLLLQDPATMPLRPRRLAWLAVSGVPLTPAFWGRFALVAALAGAFGGSTLLVTVPVTGALVVVALRAAGARTAAAPGAWSALRVAAWLPPLAALTVGAVPATALRTLLGVG